jgi:hypothetical protein
MRSSKSCYLLFKGKNGPTASNPVVKDMIWYVTSLPCTLGRAPDGPSKVMINQDDSTLSRDHVEVNWSNIKSCYELTCLSKNGCVLNGQRLFKGSASSIHSNDAIRIGAARFYVSLPSDLLEGPYNDDEIRSAGKAKVEEMMISTPDDDNSDDFVKKPPSKKRRILNSGSKSPLASSPSSQSQTQVNAATTVTLAMQDESPKNSQKTSKAKKTTATSGSSEATSSTPTSNDGWMEVESKKAIYPPATTAATTKIKPEKRKGGPEEGSTAIMVSKAFASGEMPFTLGLDGSSLGVTQNDIHEWIIKNYPNVEINSAFKKSVYSVITRKCQRVEPAVHPTTGKKMPLLWSMNAPVQL